MAVVAVDIFEVGVFTDATFADYTSDFVSRLDIINKLIFIKKDVISFHPTTELYPEVRTIRRIDESVRKKLNPVSTQGNEPAGTKFTPRRAVLNDGWRIAIEYDTDWTLSVTGEMISDDGFAGAQLVKLNYLPEGVSTLVNYTPADAEIIEVSVGGGVAPTAQEIWEYVDRQLTVASGLTVGQEAKLDAIPTNTVLTTDLRLDYLDSNISSITGSTPAEIWAYTTRSLTASTTTDLTPVLDAIAALNNITAAEIEAALINEADGQTIINAIVGAIGNTNIDEIALVAAIRADVERIGGMLSLVPTNPLLTNDGRLANLDAPISGAKLTTLESAQLMAIPLGTALTSDSRFNNLDAAISTRSTLTASNVWANVTRELTSANEGLTLAQEAKLDAIPTNPLLTNDGRLDYLNAPVSSAIINPADIWGFAERELTVPSGLTTTQAAKLIAIPSNPVLTTDGRLDNIATVAGDVWTVVSRELTSPAGLTVAQEIKLDAIPTNPVLASDGRLDFLDSAVSASGLTLAENTQLMAIQLNTLATDDVRLNNLDAAVSSAGLTVTENTRLMSIPTNPLLTSDIRLVNLDSPISNIVDFDASAVWSYTTRDLTTIFNGLTIEQETKLLAIPSAQENAQALFEEPLPISPSAGSYGDYVKNKLLTLFRFKAHK